ncbi:hypothetical protein [Mucilaginibacter sp. NFX135]|uniref:hypothetical protein n=1 Tax=Mucilaginibacter sp. NFX135 TaxID=3402687 RepID=UPI003AFA27FE
MERAISKYYDLKFDLENLNYKLNLYNNDEGKYLEEIKAINQEISSKQNELNDVNIYLDKENEIADKIRSNLIAVMNNFLFQFNLFKEKGLFPTLGQGLIIPVYIFWKILSDLKYTLTYEGYGYPISWLQAGKDKWEINNLELILKSTIAELSASKFTTFKQAIGFYENIIEKFKQEYNVVYQANYK